MFWKQYKLIKAQQRLCDNLSKEIHIGNTMTLARPDRCEVGNIESNFAKTLHMFAGTYSTYFCRVWRVCVCVKAYLCAFVLLTVLPSCQLFLRVIYSLLCGIAQISQAGVRVPACVDLYLWPVEMCVGHVHWWSTSLLIAYIANHPHIKTLLMQISGPRVCVCGVGGKEWQRKWERGHEYMCRQNNASCYLHINWRYTVSSCM